MLIWHFLNKTKHTPSLWPHSSPPGYLLRRHENVCSHQDLCKSALFEKLRRPEERVLVCSCNGIAWAVTGPPLTSAVLSQSGRGRAERSRHRRCRRDTALWGKVQAEAASEGWHGLVGKGPWDLPGARPARVLVEVRVILVYVFVTTPPWHMGHFYTLLYVHFTTKVEKS